MSLNLKIVNRSAWPDWFLEPVAKWIATKAGIAWGYRLTVRSTRDRHTWGGRGGSCSGSVKYHRRAVVAWKKDSRFKWGPSYDLRPGLEMFVFLIAHEIYHATGGHPDKFKLPNGRTNADLMEFRTSEWAVWLVGEFRREWPSFVRLFLSRKRRERARAVRRQERAAAISSAKSRPEARLADKLERLKRWESKAKRAQMAILKLRRSIRALERNLSKNEKKA